MIRTNINLATDPFRRDRPMLVASVAAAALLALMLLVSVGIIVSERHQAKDTRALLDRLETQTAKIAAEQNKLDATLHKPENAEVLERSLFLNSLIERKAISWTRIFADLEKVMPANVRLVSVRLPQVDSRNQVLLDMVVGADDPAPVLQLFKKLEDAPQFGPTSLVNSIPPSQTDKLWKYRVSVNYAQKL
jgi:type IV pilus assembly protein PilN